MTDDHFNIEEKQIFENLKKSQISVKYYIPIGLWVSLITFLVGSFIFGWYLINPNKELLKISIYAFIFISLIHIPIVLIIAGRAVKDDNNYKRLMLVCGLIVLNLPIFILASL